MPDFLTCSPLIFGRASVAFTMHDLDLSAAAKPNAGMNSARIALLSTGDRTILGSISRRGNRYLRALFVQAAWVVLVRVKCWERYGLKSWIEAAKKRLHHNVLAIALANKLARIAWAVLNKGRAFECVKTEEVASRPA